MKKRDAKKRPNRHGCLIDKGPGRNFLAKWSVDGKTYVRSTGEKDYYKALEKLDEFTRSLRHDEVADTIEALKDQIRILERRREKTDLPLAKLWETYISTQWENPVAEGTERGYRLWTGHLVHWLGRNACRTLGDVDHAKAELYLQSLRKGLGKATYNNRLCLFRKIWNVLHEKGYLADVDTWAGFSLAAVPKNKSRRRALTTEEIRSLIDAADDDMKLLIYISAYTGLRLGDCCCLKWSEVDFGRRLITVVPRKTKGHDTVVQTPIHHDLLALLQERKDRNDGSEYVCARNARQYETSSIEHRLKKLFKDAGLRSVEKDEDGKTRIVLSFHSLRHTFLTQVANTGLSVYAAARLMGHTSTRTSETYFHQLDSAVREKIETLKVS